MTLDRCRLEEELLDALGRGFVGAELDAHARECPACNELRQVAAAVLDERRQAMSEAAVPSAGTMLWRMQMRQRHEAQATARRSLITGQAVTLVFAIALLLSFFGSDLTAQFRTLLGSIRVSTPILLVLATSLLLAPLAGWAAIRQK